jgi:hypothetical protein
VQELFYQTPEKTFGFSHITMVFSQYEQNELFRIISAEIAETKKKELRLKTKMFRKMDESIDIMYDNKQWLENLAPLLNERQRITKYYILISDISVNLKPVDIQSEFRLHMKYKVMHCTSNADFKGFVLAYLFKHCKMDDSETTEIIKMLQEGLSKI